MLSDDLVCPCGAEVEPVQDDAGVFFRCCENCGLVDATPAPTVEAALDAWLVALPLPTLEDALETYISRSAQALLYATTPQELVQVAPLARVLISYRQLQSVRPEGGPT